MNNQDRIDPKEFDARLQQAEDKFIDPSSGKPFIPTTITIDPNAKTLPFAIRRKVNNSSGLVKMKGSITRAPKSHRSGFGVLRYAIQSEGTGQFIFRFFPETGRTPDPVNDTYYDLPIASILDIEISMSPYFTAAPVKVNPVQESEDTFINFLDSLKRNEEDAILIESAKEGYKTCIKGVLE